MSYIVSFHACHLFSPFILIIYCFFSNMSFIGSFHTSTYHSLAHFIHQHIIHWLISYINMSFIGSFHTSTCHSLAHFIHQHVIHPFIHYLFSYKTFTIILYVSFIVSSHICHLLSSSCLSFIALFYTFILYMSFIVTLHDIEAYTSYQSLRLTIHTCPCGSFFIHDIEAHSFLCIIEAYSSYLSISLVIHTNQ